MNNHSNNSNALLVEIMIAVLFFSLCATVLLRTFVTVHTQSTLCGTRNAALAEAQDVAEQLKNTDDSAKLLAGLSFEEKDGQWMLEDEENQYVLICTLDSESRTNGTMQWAVITANEKNGTELFSFHTALYTPAEVTE